MQNAFIGNDTMQKLKFVVILSLSLFATACATHVNNEVVRFNTIDVAAYNNISVVANEENDANGIEFGLYKSLIEDAFQEQGLSITENSTDLTAKVAFTRSAGKYKLVPLHGIPSPRGYWRNSLGYSWGYYYYPTLAFSPFYEDDPYVRRKLYEYSLIITIDNNQGERVFEGKVMTENRENETAKIMPYLIEAMFVDFPGKSGETKHILIKKDSEKDR